MSGTVFIVEKISKAFGPQPVLRELSVSFNAGECTLLLGANGAGKSTMLRICSGLLRPDSGRVAVDGKRPVPSFIGYAGHLPLLYGALTVEENLALLAQLGGVTTPLSEHLSRWELEVCRNRQINELSQGQRSRAALARAFLQQPRFIFLDEPSSALDEHAFGLLRDAIAECRNAVSDAASVVIATHDITRMRPLASRAIVLNSGCIAADSCDAKDQVIAQYMEANR